MNLTADNTFARKLAEHALPLRHAKTEILQINVGKLCNLTCIHCHVNAGPKRKEIMSRATIDRLIDWLARTDIPTVDRFETTYQNVDLTTFTNFLELQGIRLAGRAGGRYLLEWPQGQWAQHTGDGEIRVTPPDGVVLAGRRTPGTVEPDRPRRAFRRELSLTPVPLGGALTFAFGPEWVDLAPSRMATPSTVLTTSPPTLALPCSCSPCERQPIQS